MDIDDLQLLAGIPVNFNNLFNIYPLKLRKIAEIGYDKYNYYISLLLFSKNNFNNNKIEHINNEEFNKASDFEIMLCFLLTDIKFKNDFMFALELFIKEKPILDERGFFYFGELEERRFIYNDNFNEIQNVIKLMNNIKPEKIEELDEFDKRVMEAEKKISQYDDNEALTLNNLISSLTNMSDNDINIFNVWDLTLYQIYDQFKRGQLKEKFIIDLKSIFAGAKSEDVNLEHYVKNI